MDFPHKESVMRQAVLCLEIMMESYGIDTVLYVALDTNRLGIIKDLFDLYSETCL